VHAPAAINVVAADKVTPCFRCESQDGRRTRADASGNHVAFRSPNQQPVVTDRLCGESAPSARRTFARERAVGCRGGGMVCRCCFSEIEDCVFASAPACVRRPPSWGGTAGGSRCVPGRWHSRHRAHPDRPRSAPGGGVRRPARDRLVRWPGRPHRFERRRQVTHRSGADGAASAFRLTTGTWGSARSGRHASAQRSGPSIVGQVARAEALLPAGES
jgi:hypothetical protein